MPTLCAMMAAKRAALGARASCTFETLSQKLVLDLRQARALDRKPSRRTALERLQADAVSVCLVAPFVEAAVADRRVALRALAQAWLAYMAAEEVLEPILPRTLPLVPWQTLRYVCEGGAHQRPDACPWDPLGHCLWREQGRWHVAVHQICCQMC